MVERENDADGSSAVPLLSLVDERINEILVNSRSKLYDNTWVNILGRGNSDGSSAADFLMDSDAYMKNRTSEIKEKKLDGSGESEQTKDQFPDVTKSYIPPTISFDSLLSSITAAGSMIVKGVKSTINVFVGLLCVLLLWYYSSLLPSDTIEFDRSDSDGEMVHKKLGTCMDSNSSLEDDSEEMVECNYNDWQKRSDNVQEMVSHNSDDHDMTYETFYVSTKESSPSLASKSHEIRSISTSNTTPLRNVEDTSSSASMTDYILSRGGSRIIRRILIANCGMAATKGISSMRSWAYMNFGDEKTIEFVVMATPEDIHANTEFIRMADVVVEVAEGQNEQNYANINMIVEIAISKQVDAVWPGWGHASENPELPKALARHRISFLGPTSTVMALLGDKISANILAQTAGVPSIPWSGDGLKALPKDSKLPDEVFEAACIHSYEECLSHILRIGYPVMIKAAQGGAGRGIRLIRHQKEIAMALRQVQGEAPSSPIFVMKHLSHARHVEVQIVGDEHGQATALSGRDCTTQRRFQKILEEGPPVIVPKYIFRKMELAAQKLVKSLGYIGAGTVEYLFHAESGMFYFLELNPRLQVEHPVTEGITGVNLPSIQLQVAMGIPLHAIPDIRKYYGRSSEYLLKGPNVMSENSFDSDIDFDADDHAPITRHVIASRVTAENPDDTFKPTSGFIEHMNFRTAPNVWGYFSIGYKGGVHEYADSQFGHIFASGADSVSTTKRPQTLNPHYSYL